MTILGSNPRATVDVSHPEAFAICDRCGFLYNKGDLSWQFRYAGNSLVSAGLLVCEPCMDVPFQLNRPVYLPPDPAPVFDARPPAWQAQSEPDFVPIDPTQIVPD